MLLENKLVIKECVMIALVIGIYEIVSNLAFLFTTSMFSMMVYISVVVVATILVILFRKSYTNAVKISKIPKIILIITLLVLNIGGIFGVYLNFLSLPINLSSESYIYIVRIVNFLCMVSFSAFIILSLIGGSTIDKISKNREK